MGSSIYTNYEEIAAVLLFVIGFLNLLIQPNLVKKIIGLDVMDAAIYLFLAAKGYIAGRTAPIVTDGILSADHYINPIPAGLVLTGIVVSVSVSAVMMALTICLYREYRTLDLDEILVMLQEQETAQLQRIQRDEREGRSA
ncbi:MAG: NADH-quinone oxidoreductase subunit K [Lachnospiraceae bacterium]|nr:NADH-quinone oxidoreductase subunit K [Lachnospiraceae bacterium]